MDNQPLLGENGNYMDHYSTYLYSIDKNKLANTAPAAGTDPVAQQQALIVKATKQREADSKKALASFPVDCEFTSAIPCC